VPGTFYPRAPAGEFLLAVCIDPGPLNSGVAVLRKAKAQQLPNGTWSPPWRVERAEKAMPNADVRALISQARHARTLVAIERCLFYGHSKTSSAAGSDLIATAEESGSMRGRALLLGMTVCMVTRREVLKHMHISGGSRDSQVRAWLINTWGGCKAVAVGRKAAPGPLFGVASHGWQALGVGAAALNI